MTLRSALDYKYRPTVNYEVTLRPGVSDTIGTLDVTFRTKSAALLETMGAFFTLFSELEAMELTAAVGRAPATSLTPGRFSRALMRPKGPFNAQSLAAAISEYVKFFDACMKEALSGETHTEIRSSVRAYLRRAELIL